ncbi:MAG: DJ-1/PfpI family protein, partial [Erysipelotrichaceae bacterium]|nr:DJ-1/PfpI family protein [Erysipelotrichaceae bacterium]
MRILCLLANGFEEGEALMPCALLRRAGLSVDICGVNEINVSGTHDIQVVS